MSKTKKRNWQGRQGDVLVERVSRKAKGEPVERENGRVVLAHGEVTGHAHAVRDPGVCMLRAEGISMLTVSRTAHALLEHEEHGHFELGGGEAGTYEVTRQRQWDWSENAARPVHD